jgi:ribose transport system substrate-binding protein
MIRRAVLVLGAVLALATTSCGGQLAPDTTKQMRVGFVPKALNQEYWVNTRHGAEAGAQAAGVKVVTLAAQSDTHIAEQIDLVENLLAQKVDALVIAPNDSELLKPVLEKAAERIPVVLFDSPIPGWKPQTAYVGTANKDGGVAMGRYLRKVAPKGTLAIIRGIPGSQVDIDRVDGVKAGIKGSGIRVVKEIAANFDRNQAVGAMENILQTNPHVSAVFCANDQMALGALQTLAARHLTGKIKLVGFDGAIEATQAIIAKQMYATVAQDPYGMAKIGIEEAVRAAKHERVKRSVNTGNPLVTQRNAEAYLRKVQKKLGSG